MKNTNNYEYLLEESKLDKENKLATKKYKRSLGLLTKNYNSSVRKKLKEIEEKDHIRNWQPPISGSEIMEIFNISAGKKVGILKNSLKDAILDGKIKNDKESAIEFMKMKAKEINLNSND